MYTDIYIILNLLNHKNIAIIMLIHAFFILNLSLFLTHVVMKQNYRPNLGHCPKWLRNIDLYSSFD